MVVMLVLTSKTNLPNWLLNHNLISNIDKVSTKN
jgi:hypothetical protein